MTTIARYRERFTGFELAHAPFAELRESALAAFEAQGYPHKRVEDWKYTNVSDVEQTEWKHERGDGAYRLVASGKEASLVRSLAEPASVHEHVGTVASLERAPFVALNSAFFQQGYTLVVPKGHAGREPLFLTHEVAGGEREVHPRGLIVVGKGATLTLVEDWRSEGRAFTNAVVEVVLEEGATLEHHVWQRQAAGAAFIATVSVKAAAKARYESFGLWLGGSLSRADLNVALEGGESFCRVDGVYVARGEPDTGQLTDVHSAIDHRVPHTQSRQVYKGLLAEHGHGVFNGKVFIQPDAQKTDSAQANHNLLLADSAEIDTKPQLEIYADDVKAAHGTTVGQLDPEQVFYLRSRGLSADAAMRMLTEAFALEVLDAAPSEAVRERAREVLREKLRELSVGGTA